MHPRDHEEPVSFGNWVGTTLLLMIPLVGIILLIYWAASDSTKASKRNFARAQLLVIGVVLALSFVIVAAGALPALAKIREASLATAARHEAEQASAETPAGGEPNAFPDTPATTATESAESASADNTPAAPAAPVGPTLTPNEPERNFRSMDGRTIQARVVSLTDELVTIRRADGQEFTTEMTRFSPEDVDYFMRLRHGATAFE
jgi:hypothetical protein